MARQLIALAVRRLRARAVRGHLPRAGARPDRAQGRRPHRDRRPAGADGGGQGRRPHGRARGQREVGQGGPPAPPGRRPAEDAKAKAEGTGQEARPQVGLPLAARGRAERTEQRRRGRRPPAEGVEPRQGALPRGRVHQGRGDRLLRPHRPGDAARTSPTAGVTLRRYPNGVDGQSFFEKRCPSHRPEWVGTFAGPGDRNGTHRLLRARLRRGAGVGGQHGRARAARADGAAATDIEAPTMCVFDLDPGAPADIHSCAEVALDIRDVLDDLAGLECLAKTSGSKGLQLYVPLNRPAHPRALLVVRAGRGPGAGEAPRAIGSPRRWPRRCGRARCSSTGARTAATRPTVAVYSLRARPRPTVSTPVTWDEVEAAADGAPLTLRGGGRARPDRGARRPVRAPPDPRAGAPRPAG